MKEQNIKTNKSIKVMNLFIGFSLIIGILFITSCVDETLPGAGSIADTTPPRAGFSYSADPTDQLKVVFTNQSESATDFTWDFGDGGTSDEENPSNTYTDFGKYTVTMMATDKLGVSSDTTIEIEVIEGPYQPYILEGGFEGDGATGDGRDPWRSKSWTESGNSWSDERSVFGISSSPVSFGDQAAKLEPQPTNPRQGYQEIIVEADQNYDLSFWYTMKDDSSDPWATIAIVGVTDHGPITGIAEAEAGIIASITVNDISDPETYVQETLSFNSGTNTTVAIYFWNDGNVETRLDEFAIEVAPEGALPPSVSFSSEQSDTDYLSYTFTNTSVNADSYEWDFGDGNTSTETSPTHIYEEADVYTVKLTAKNEAGLSAEYSSSFEIHAPVTAAFTYEIDDDDYKTYSFMDASEDAVSLLWEFGDGFQYTGMDPIHTYDLDGIYTVKLTATSLTGFEDVEEVMVTVAQGFIVQILNGTFDEYTLETGDNADAWDMTPNSTVVDNDGNTVDSPYDPLWDNSDLDSWLDTFYGDDSEQPGSSSDGNNDTRGAKLEEPSRRLYQVVTVEAGETYTFSIDSRTSGVSAPTDVYILNTEIADETGINASDSDAAIDEYFEITNDFNTDSDEFTTSTFDFTPSTNKIVIYVRNVNVVDNVTEAWYDNITVE
ncbi:MAG: PKD domain-containing protein [Reichenbachiella sp.]|uniref:PKD domain-containing protein n=1 Tax=Reichenbachiella sp. TaxID=2184521 RepID=UPI0032971C3E